MLVHVYSSNHSGNRGVNIVWALEFNTILGNIVRWRGKESLRIRDKRGSLKKQVDENRLESPH